jgi:Flp pilus assembly pilin Flp
MDHELIQTTAIALGIGLGGGFNIYATILMLGISGATGSVNLPTGLEVLENPLVILAAGLMYGVEFFADKIPGFDSIWDTIHTFIRIPLGAILAGDAMAEYGVVAESVSMIIGGGLSSATHFTKSGTRAIINTSPEPVSNWTASISEDAAVFGGVWAAINHPVIWVITAIVIIAIMVWVIPKLWRGIKLVFNKIAGLFGKKSESKPQDIKT